MVCAIAGKVYALNEGRVVAEIVDAITPEVCEPYL
jgi:hypothetical protein